MRSVITRSQMFLAVYPNDERCQLCQASVACIKTIRDVRSRQVFFVSMILKEISNEVSVIRESLWFS